MNVLSPARMRAFTPDCSTPGLWLPWVAFLVVTAAALALLARGVPGTALAGVLLAMAVLTTVLGGPNLAGSGTGTGRVVRHVRVHVGPRLARRAVTA